MRIERDALGEVQVPEEALWGPQTQRAVENFPVSGSPFPLEAVHALAMIKAEAARWSGGSRRMPQIGAAVARAIAEAADEVAEGRWDEQFPVDVFQTGSGTSTNMNVNEVLARLAGERLGEEVHPNDHVNAGQSSNDTVPSAVHLAAALALRDDLLPGLEVLSTSLRAAGKRFRRVVKAGRTHLMDATPVNLGAAFTGYAHRVEDAAQRLEAALPDVCTLPLGGTAVGTGLNAPPAMAGAVIAALAERTGLPLMEAEDHLAAHAGRDPLVDLSGRLRAAALVLAHIAEDLRMMGSGPVAGLAELRLPAVAPGSSIMPGKVNPVLPEMALQVAAQVMGNDAAVGAAALVGGRFELFCAVPVLARNVLESIHLLANASRLFAERCVDGLEADAERCRLHAEASPAIATALAPRLGYDTTAALVKRAVAERRPVREVVAESGEMDADELDRLLDPVKLAKGGMPPS